MTAHLFILLSYAEGSPNSAIESATYGVPLLLSNVGGNVDLIKRIGGSLVEPEDHQRTAKAIENIFSNRQTWEFYSLNTYLKSTQYSIKNMAKSYADLYEL
jgi:glycosyltransferase involved in cell wall biosynthesis